MCDIYLHNNIGISFADQPLLLNVESLVDRHHDPASRSALSSLTGLIEKDFITDFRYLDVWDLYGQPCLF